MIEVIYLFYMFNSSYKKRDTTSEKKRKKKKGMGSKMSNKS